MLRLYSDLKRILVLTENLLYLAGKSLQRRAMRNGVLVTLAMSSGIVKTNVVAAQTLSPDQITALVVGAFASYPAGAVLLRLAGFLTRDNIEAAAGGHLHLTSHYKQSRMRLHLHYLWHEVFSNDGDVRPRPPATDEYSLDKRSARPLLASGAEPLPRADRTDDTFGLFVEKPFADEGEREAHDRFVAAGLEALRSPLPMGVQSARTGFHLGPVEDWYEKGFFSYEDFPAKGFSRDPLIKRSYRLVNSAARVRVARLVVAEAAPSFWYAFTVRKFCTMLGKAIISLNRDAERAGYPDYFDAQHFTWPSADLDAEVSRRFAAGGAPLDRRLFELRKLLMREVFSPDAETARRHVMRMFARDYAWIFRLRMRFDGVWAAGQLPGRPMVELDAVESAFSLSILKRGDVDRLAASARANLAALDDALAACTEVAVPAGAYRLMQIAAHTDFRGFRSRHLAEPDHDALPRFARSAQQFERDFAVLGELLHRVRIYHALIKMQVLDYWSIVSRIGELDHRP